LDEEIRMSETVDVSLTPDEARALLRAWQIEESPTSADEELLHSAEEKLRIGLVEIGEAA
jgi:hypothetical protein